MSSALSFLELLQPLQPREPLPPALSFAGRDSEKSPDSGDIQESRRQADEIISRAAAEAQTLIEDAQAQSEAIREAAWQEGFHEGRTTAQTATEISLRSEWECEKSAIRERFSQIMDEIATARQTLWERQEGEMIEFVLTIARQVIKTEVTQNPEVIQNVLRNALRRVTDKDQVRIRVSAGDAPAVRALREELLEITDGLRHLEIVDDRRVGPGGCVIETAAGTIDAKIETQFSEVERALGVNSVEAAQND